LQLAIATRPRRFRPTAPGVIPVRRDIERATEHTNSEGGLLRDDPRELHCWCFAKKAAAFFRISRSVRSSRFSFRRRASSSRSAVVKPVRPCVRSARARVTQMRRLDSVRSRSRATLGMLLPSSSTSRTACALKSSSNRRRWRRVVFGVSAMARDIVSTFRKMSTKSDQAHSFFVSICVLRDGRIAHERRVYDLTGLLQQLATDGGVGADTAQIYHVTLERARIEQELKLAAEIQRALLPVLCRKSAGFDVAAASLPCRAIGGDFIDYFNLPSGGLGFVLGDVAGKGPPAALLAAELQGIAAALSWSESPLSETVTRVN